MHTGRTPYEDEGRDQGDASINWRMPTLPVNHQKVRERHGTDCSSQPSEGTNPADTLI